MNFTFSIFLFLTIFILTLTFAIHSLSKKDKVGRLITTELFLIAFTIASYMFVIALNKSFWMQLFNSITTLGIDWICFLLILLILQYSDTKPRKIELIIYGCILSVDSILVLSNPFTNIVCGYNEIIEQGKMYLSAIPKPYFYVHYSICYLSIAFCIGFLVYKFIKEPKLYKIKYGVLIVVLALIVSLTLLWYILNISYIDYSLISYCIAAAMIYIMYYHYIPFRIVSKIQNLTNDKSFDGIFIFDKDNMICYLNEIARIIIPNYSKTLKETLVIIDDMLVIRNGIAYLTTKSNIYTFTKEAFLDDKGQVIATLLAFKNSTVIENAKLEISYLASHDELTGLYTKHHFYEMVEQKLKNVEDKNETFSMFSIMIDNFKVIEDVFGNQQLDHVLISISTILKEHIQEYDYLCGLIKSDTFVVFKKTSSDAIQNVADQLILQMKESIKHIPIKIKTGVIHFHVGDNLLEVYEKAVIASRYCKESVFCIYEQKIMDRNVKEKKLLNDFKEGLKNHQFVVYLQPQVDTITNTLYGAEALVRWEHPEYGLLKPSEFISLLEKNQMIHELDFYVWKKVGQMVASFKNTAYENLPISVNVSVNDFYNFDLPSIFKSIIEQNKIDPKLFVIEITEGVFMIDQQQVIASVNKLKELGFIIEIDDFGSGFSSLNILKEIPCDVVKLDFVFLKNYDSFKAKSILKDTINLVYNINLKVIAEGVETKEQLKFLQNIRCNIIQGFYFSSPLPLPQFLNFNVLNK